MNPPRPLKPAFLILIISLRSEMNEPYFISAIMDHHGLVPDEACRDEPASRLQYDSIK